MTTSMLTYRPPRIAMLLLILAALWHWFLPAPALFTARPLAALLGSTGFVVMMRAWWQFQRHKVAICPTSKTDYLITDGIYRYTRNPMYLGIVMMLISVATWFGTLPFATATIAYFIVMQRVFCPYEEAQLTATFGQEYQDYRLTVRRWI